jgi:hypothetical protein
MTQRPTMTLKERIEALRYDVFPDADFSTREELCPDGEYLLYDDVVGLVCAEGIKHKEWARRLRKCFEGYAANGHFNIIGSPKIIREVIAELEDTAKNEVPKAEGRAT